MTFWVVVILMAAGYGYFFYSRSFDDGAIVELAVPGQDAVEIDIAKAAIPVLVGWSKGESVVALPGPIPVQGVV